MDEGTGCVRYGEALDLFGLRFRPGSWQLAPRRDATREQREARRRWLSSRSSIRVK